MTVGGGKGEFSRGKHFSKKAQGRSGVMPLAEKARFCGEKT